MHRVTCIISCYLCFNKLLFYFGFLRLNLLIPYLSNVLCERIYANSTDPDEMPHNAASDQGLVIVLGEVAVVKSSLLLICSEYYISSAE